MFRRSKFPITRSFELLPRSPTLAESGAVCEHRGFISSVFCFLGFVWTDALSAVVPITSGQPKERWVAGRVAESWGIKKPRD
jgi:hypothetical protein